MKALLCRVWVSGVSPSFKGIILEELDFFLCRKDPGGNTAPPPSKKIEKIDAIIIHSETTFSQLNFCILSKGVCRVGLPLKDDVFWWFGNCFLVTF